MPEMSSIVTEFPRRMLPLLRCSRDAGQLSICREYRSGTIGLIDATLRCSACSQEYSVENGVVRLLPKSLTPETQHEMAIKSSEYEQLPDTFESPSHGWRSEYSDYIEVPPHLEWLEPLNGCRVLELGCGDGRFTMLMAKMGADVLAIDFTLAALSKLATRLSSGVAPTSYRLAPQCIAKIAGCVGMVQADASNFHVAPRSFDRALSATPCDSRDERMKMYRAIAESLTDEGCYVGGVEHDDLGRRLLGLPLVRRYTTGGILIDHLDTAMMRREVAPYFSRLRFRPIRPRDSFISHLSTKHKILILRTISAIPVLRQLGEILLVRAEGPIRLPLEGARRPGSTLAKSIYRWHKRRQGEEPLWTEVDPV